MSYIKVNIYKFFKRLFDLIFSIVLIITISPFLVLIYILLKFTGEGEVFYLQERIGFHNKNFKIIKFATMVKNSPNIGTGSITLRNDPRVLPVGRFLRKSKLNEIPQLFNVLRGDMSFVGPRPQMEVDFLKFPASKRDDIYNVKPGITGLGSIYFRDEEKLISNHKGNKHEFYKKTIAPYKTQLELYYNNNLSFWLDIKILIVTSIVVLFPSSIRIEKIFKNIPQIKN